MARGDKHVEARASAEPRRRGSDFTTAEAAIASLARRRDAHRLWENPLLTACAAGHLTRHDLAFIFGQYALFSRNFTRFLNAVMANCPDDLFRARIAENLWEEAGQSNTNTRHSELFRSFLRDGLAVDIETVAYIDGSRLFVHECLDFCLHGSPIAGSAFLGLGSEGIVPRLYDIFMQGLRRAGVAEPHLEFFRVHVACDDKHADTLQQLVASYYSKPGWYRTALAGMTHALDLRDAFFASLFAELHQRRIAPKLERIHARASLAAPDQSVVHSCLAPAGELLYQNVNDRLGIDFKVHRLPFAPEVLDPRLVEIAPGKANELHKHAHETVFYIVRGKGRVRIDDREVAVNAGDTAFVPRWCMHQTCNDGPEPMIVLAITDFEFTRKALIGDYRKTARHNEKSSNAFGLTGVLADIELDDLGEA